MFAFVELVKHERNREKDSVVKFRAWHFAASQRDQITSGNSILKDYISVSLEGRVFNSGSESVEFNIRDIEILEKDGRVWKAIDMETKDSAWQHDNGWERTSIGPKSSMACHVWQNGCYHPGLEAVFGKPLKFRFVLDAIGQEAFTVAREFQFSIGTQEVRWHDSANR